VGSLFPSVPTSRGIIFHTLHLAVQRTWGPDALAAVIAGLPEEVARETSGPEFLPIRWYPTSHLTAWQNAIYDGMAKGDDAAYATCIDRSLDLTLGGVRRLFMRVVAPHAIAERAGDMWRHFHSHGWIEIDWRTETSGRVVLSEHGYAQDVVGRRTFAEMIRYMLALSRAKDVRESHGLDAAGRLAVTVSWRGAAT
jgi:hypothetical protein